MIVEQAAQTSAAGPLSKTRRVTIGTGEPTGDKTTDAGYAAYLSTLAYIESKGGRFTVDDYGEPQLILAGKQIPLTPDNKNIGLNSILVKATNYTMTGQIGRTAATLLQIHGKQAGDKIKGLPFSHLDRDACALYIPHTGDKLLKVTTNTVTLEDNGAEELWLNSPVEEEAGMENPMTYRVGNAEAALAQFERLCVETIPVEAPAMRWLVAMQEGFFPYVRHLTTEMMILVHKGKSGSAKTFSAARFHQLHGLGKRVIGDVTTAWIRNGGCNRGFFAFDNKESHNLTPELIDLLLQISTGAKSGRSSSDGKQLQSGMKDRPVTVVTSIEGLALKEELEKRTITVNFKYLPLETQVSYNADQAMKDINAQRNNILSAFAAVFQQFLRDNDVNHVRYSASDIPTQALRFKGNYGILMQLLRAYGKVTGRPASWAEDIIAGWRKVLNDVEHFESPIELALDIALRKSIANQKVKVSWRGKEGTLYVCSPSKLHTALLGNSVPREIREQIPKNVGATSARIKSLSGPRFYCLDEENAPEHAELLKRTSGRRTLGVFAEGPGIDEDHSFDSVLDVSERAA